MAATRQAKERAHTRLPPRTGCLSAQELLHRLEEEIARAQRLGGDICCLLVRLDDFEQIARSHGAELSEAALVHAGQALGAELRRYDRVGRPDRDQLLLLLPGAGTSEGEAVARRALRRIMAIKIEVGRVRVPMSVSVGIAAWQASWSAQRLIEEARAAAGSAGRAGISISGDVDGI